MKIFSSITEIIGNTPLVELKNYAKECGCVARLVGKLEYMNPAGSAKDRIALEMIKQAEISGKLTAGGTVIEPTSGNTGIGLAAIAASRGYKVIITMPETMSAERRMLMKAYGAELVLTDGSKGMSGAIEKAEELSKSIPGSIIAGQFTNKANPDAHFKTTGPEIWDDTDGKTDVFVASVGTGGTLTGTGEYLKSRNGNIYICAVEPTDSPLLSKGYSGPHKLQGIGANFVPEILNTELYDEIITASTEEAFKAARTLAKTEGLLCGISSGAALFAATEIAKRPEFAEKLIVVLLPDTGERYLSSDLFEV